MIKLINLKTNDLNKNLIKEILKLKETHWKNGLISQKKYFKKNILKDDEHIILYYKACLSGYVLLRKKQCKYNNKKLSYFHFDTLIIKKNLRNQKLSMFIMNFVKSFIKFKKTISILYCNKNVINFYKKFSWKKVNYKEFELKIKKPNKKYIMVLK